MSCRDSCVCRRRFKSRSKPKRYGKPLRSAYEIADWNSIRRRRKACHGCSTQGLPASLGGALPVLWRAYERTSAWCLSHDGRPSMVEDLATSQSEASPPVASHATVHPTLVSAGPCLSPVPAHALWRHHPRWEPDALAAPVRIFGGGRERSRSLLRPSDHPRVAPILRAILPLGTLFRYPCPGPRSCLLGQEEIQEAAPSSPPSDAVDRAHFATCSAAVCPLADGVRRGSVMGAV
jgi:hypothetical protein